MKSPQNRDRRLLMDISVEGRVGAVMPSIDVPLQDLPANSLLRTELELPEVTEPEIVRYFTRLSQLNFSIDTGAVNIFCSNNDAETTTSSPSITSSYKVIFCSRSLEDLIVTF